MVIRTVTTQDQSQKAKRDAEEEKELFRREEVDAKFPLKLDEVM